MTGLEIFELALRNKTEIYEFYLEKSNQIKNFLSREMFKRIIDDEAFHLQRIREGYEHLKKGENFTNEVREGLRKSSREYFDSIFSETLKNQLDTIVNDPAEFKILENTLALETKNHRFFIAMEKEIEEVKIKEFLSFLACEEYRHYNLLYNTYELMCHPQEWLESSKKSNGKEPTS